MPKFRKGETRPASSGRKPGSLNKVSATFKEAMDTAYRELGGDKSFVAWCRKNADAFYGQLLPKLLPKSIVAELDVTERSTCTVVVESGISMVKPVREDGESLTLYHAKLVVWEHQRRLIYGEPGRDD